MEGILETCIGWRTLGGLGWVAFGAKSWLKFAKTL